MSYYEILELTPEASEVEIKAAYRRLALRFHPDSGSPGDVERFRAIKEAYETLSDSEKRRAYDRALAGPVLRAATPRDWGGVRMGSAPRSWTSGLETPVPPFHEVFSRPRSRPDIALDIVLTAGEARRGGDVVLEIRNERVCPECQGTGFGFFGWCEGCRGAGATLGYERLVFHIPRDADSGQIVLARRRDGSSVRARLRVEGAIY